LHKLQQSKLHLAGVLIV